MFCPKCGAENPEANKYCRTCRENLQVISQAMKGHLPVVIASKIDQILDSRSERFRRDSLLNLLMSVTTLLAGFSTWQSRRSGGYIDPILFFGICVCSARLALREYRAYRRSLSPDFDWEGSVEESRDTVGERDFRGRLAPDSNWRGYDQKDHRDSLNYRLGRVVGKVYRSPSNTGTSGSFSSLGRVRSAPDHRETGDKATSAAYFANASPPSVTESTTRQLDSPHKQPREQSRTMYCPSCGCANDQRAGSCGACGGSLEGLGKVLELRGHNSRMAKLDKYIREKNDGLAAASKNFTLFIGLYWLVYLVTFVIFGMRQSTPKSWYVPTLAVVSLVAGAWDRIAYRRKPPARQPDAQRIDPGLRIIEATASTIDAGAGAFSEDGRILRINCARPPTVDTGEARPIREWQQHYPGVWMLIEVTSEDERGVSEGKLIATARDRSAFRRLDESYDERYLVAIYGGG